MSNRNINNFFYYFSSGWLTKIDLYNRFLNNNNNNKPCIKRNHDYQSIVVLAYALCD